MHELCVILLAYFLFVHSFSALGDLFLVSIEIREFGGIRYNKQNSFVRKRNSRKRKHIICLGWDHYNKRLASKERETFYLINFQIFKS